MARARSPKPIPPPLGKLAREARVEQLLAAGGAPERFDLPLVEEAPGW